MISKIFSGSKKFRTPLPIIDNTKCTQFFKNTKVSKVRKYNMHTLQ